MASYHFKIKIDKKPKTGEQISAATHVDYIDREGKYKNIDQERQEEKNLYIGNTLSAANINMTSNINNYDEQKQTLLYQNQCGSIIEKDHNIGTSVNSSIETLHIALALAIKQYGNEIQVQGTNEYKAQVIVAAVEMKLPIHFSDSLMEQKRNQLQEEQECGTRKIVGNSIEQSNGRESINKPNIERIGKNAPPQRRNHLQTLSELDVVQLTERSELLLSSNVSGNVDNERSQTDYPMRRDISRARKLNAEKIAENILAEKQVLAADHAQYINREAAFQKRGGCVHKDSYLPVWANGSAKTFFEAADKYEDADNIRYREIEFALPNELTLEQQVEVVNEFVDHHLGKDHYWALAIHDKEAAMGNGERNSHVHIMFSERKLDEIERQKERIPEILFKNYNRYHPENGGCRKDEKWNGANRAAYVIEMRKDCAMIQNRILEKYGFDVTVDHRSLVAQREAALERGDKLLAQLLDRKPEDNVGPRNASQPNHEKVLALKQYRQVKKEHQQLIIAADVLQKSIIKDEINQSVEATFEQATSALSEIKNNNLDNNITLEKLSKNIVDISKELSVVRNLIIWDAEALAMARRALMTPEELQLEQETKLISEEKVTLKRLEKELVKPEAWKQSALTEYTKTKKEITNRLTVLDQKSKELSTKLKEVNSRFYTKDNKIKIAKEQQKILTENQPAKKMATDLQHKLDTAVAQTKQIILENINTKAQFIDQKTNELLATPLAEKATLEKEIIELVEAKKQFEAKPKPKFYYDDKVKEAWKQEQISLQQREEELTCREKEINTKIETIKKAIYEPPKAEQEIPTPDITPISASIKEIQYTAKQIQSIIEPELRSLKAELSRIEYSIKQIEPKVISKARAEEMAKNIFVKGGFKAAHEEQADIKKESYRIGKAVEERQKSIYELNTMEKPKWYQEYPEYEKLQKTIQEMDTKIQERETILSARTSANIKQVQTLETLCLTPEAQTKISNIIAGILDKNKSITQQHTDLILKRNGITKDISEITKLKIAVDKQVKNDISESTRTKKPVPKYQARQTTTSVGGGGGGGGASKFNIPNPVAAIAQAFAGDSKAVALVMRIDDTEELDFDAMTQEQIETAMIKIQKDRDL